MKKKKQSRYWQPDEHIRFLEAVKKYGIKDVRAISIYVGTRSSTQVRTHAQKWLLKHEREHKNLNGKYPQTFGSNVDPNLSQEFINDRINAELYGENYKIDDGSREVKPFTNSEIVTNDNTFDQNSYLIHQNNFGNNMTEGFTKPSNSNTMYENGFHFNGFNPNYQTFGNYQPTVGNENNYLNTNTSSFVSIPHFPSQNEVPNQENPGVTLSYIDKISDVNMNQYIQNPIQTINEMKDQDPYILYNNNQNETPLYFYTNISDDTPPKTSMIDSNSLFSMAQTLSNAYFSKDSLPQNIVSPQKEKSHNLSNVIGGPVSISPNVYPFYYSLN